LPAVGERALPAVGERALPAAGERALLAVAGLPGYLLLVGLGACAVALQFVLRRVGGRKLW
jgi:hypothetical protein